MDEKPRAAVLIDGSNFYFKTKDLGLNNLLDFDFGKFADFLADNGQITFKSYYVGKVRTDGSKKVQKGV